MKLQPARGFLFAEAISTIPKQDKNKDTGFGIKTEKVVPEEPYKFRVTAVGAPKPIGNQLIESEVKIGDVISHVSTNRTFRESIHESGFMEDGNHYIAIDFQDVLGVWKS